MWLWIWPSLRVAGNRELLRLDQEGFFLARASASQCTKAKATTKWLGITELQDDVAVTSESERSKVVEISLEEERDDTYVGIVDVRVGTRLMWHTGWRATG